MESVAFADRPTRRPYARLELERRFLVERFPEGLDAGAFERIEDAFIVGTHLRLRRLTRPDGSWIVTKLGQKIVDPEAPDDPRRREMTTIYVPEAEGLVLASLPAVRATKRRYKIREQGWTFCVDVWEAPTLAAGTMLAEVETPTLDELERIVTPPWAAREVTDDPRYGALHLATMTSALKGG